MLILKISYARFLFTLLLAAQAGTAQKKDLARIDDPVVIQGAQLESLCGSLPEVLSLMAFKDNRWTPVPFQIDQKKPDGDYAYTMGPKAGPDPDPNLDQNDELVFIVKDAGDKIPEPKSIAWPEAAVAGLEIEITDPKDGARGWAYLFRFEGAAPRSRDDYIHLKIDRRRGRRQGNSKELAIGAPLDRVYPDYIAQMDPKTGRPGKDVLDRLKIRGELKFPGDIVIPFSADELIKCRDTGYIDGPVRALHQAWGFMEIKGIEVKGMGYSTLTYYPNHVIVPVTIEASAEIPAWLREYIPDGRVAGYMDFNSNVYGSYVVNAANPYHPEVVLDGKMSAAEKALDRETEINWVAGFGPEGGLVVRLILEEPAASRSRMVTYYVDDENGEDQPEDHPGVSSVGFEITGREGNMSDLANRTTFYLYAYAKRDLSLENLHTLLDILDHPLEIKTTDLGD